MPTPSGSVVKGVRRPLGLFEVEVGVGNQHGGDLAPVTAMVDTGFLHFMMSESLMTRLGVAPLERQPFTFANGESAEYGLAFARFAIGGRELPCPVILGPEGQYLLGATTLEIFSFAVDPSTQQLIPRAYRARSI